MDDKITEMLDMRPEDDVIEMVPANQDENLPAVTEEIEKNDDVEKVEKDTEHARENIYALIATGDKAIQELKDIANQSQHPRSYEVLGTFLKLMVEANKDLLDIHKTKRDILNPKGAPDGGGDNVKQKNQIFVGSTDELLKLMENDKE